MKLRRALPAFIVLAGFLVLILGVTGVLSPKKPEIAKTTEQGAAQKEDTIENFEVSGENWVLKAEQARRLKTPSPPGAQAAPPTGAATLGEGGYELVNPSLQVKRAGAAGEERLTVQAREGSIESEKASQVRMSGGVRIEFSGEEKVVLTTPSAEMEPDQGTGRTADDVEMVVDSKDGRQRLWGKGAEFFSNLRLVTVLQNIRMEISGGEGGLFPQAAGQPSGTTAAPVTKIECRGPATADGFSRTAVLKGDVRVEQGENALRADRVEIQFAENSRKPERFVAEGAVTFKASGAEGACDRLARNAAEDQLLLEGKPARVNRGANEIEAARIEINGRQGEIVVPVAGRLKLAGEAAANPATSAAGRPADAAVVKWSRMLRLDPNEHQARFLGDVHFERGGQAIECQTLTVKLDSQNRQILECKAETDVRLTARMQGGAGSEPATAQARELEYDPQSDSAILSGNASVQQGDRKISGERIEIHPREAAVSVTGPGRLEGQAAPGSEGFSISWKDGMAFDRAKEESDFKGGVQLKYGGDTLEAERVTAQLSEKALKGFDATGGVGLSFAEGVLRADSLRAGFEGAALRTFEAKGSVTLNQAEGAGKPGRMLKSDNLSGEIGADQKPKWLDATGNVTIVEEVPAEHKTRTLTADEVKSTTDEKSNLQGYVATGRVTLREDGPGGVRTMRADRIEAKVGAGNALETFEATGRQVVVEQNGQTARGDRLTWDAQRDSGTLFGSPAELDMGQDRVFGDRVVFAPKGGEVTILSNRRVEATVIGAPH